MTIGVVAAGYADAATFGYARLALLESALADGKPALRVIRDGGGNGSIIGRNSFQRKREDALDMLAKLVDIYKGRA